MSPNSLLRVVAGAAGFLMLYLTFFLHEDEEGAIRNRLADLWVTIDDLRKNALTLNSAFLRVTSRLALRALDTLFGERLISLKSLRSCSLFSIASALLSFTFMFSLGYRYGLLHDPYATLNAAALGLVILLVGVLAAFADGWRSRAQCGFADFLGARNAEYPMSRRAIEYSIAIQLFAGCLAVVMPVQMLIQWILDNATPIWTILVFCAVLLSDLLFIAFTRWILRRIVSANDSATMLAALVLNIAGAVLLNGPFWSCMTFYSAIDRWERFGAFPPDWQRRIAVATYRVFGARAIAGEGPVNYVLAVSATNTLDSLLAGSFVALIILTLLHRLVWPLLERPVYAAHRHNLLSNKRVLPALGIGLLLYAFNSQHHFLHALKAIRDIFR